MAQIRKERKVKKTTLVVLIFMGVVLQGVTLASPIDWVTISPVKGGVLTYDFDGQSTVLLGTNDKSRGQAIGIYGAGFYTELGGNLDMSILFSTWDSSYYDRLTVTVSEKDFRWDSYFNFNQKKVVQLGGKSWTDGKIEKYGFEDSLILGPGNFFSFFLETTKDTAFFSEAVGKFDFTANQPAPVPEPATMLLFGVGLVGMAGFGRGQKKK